MIGSRAVVAIVLRNLPRRSPWHSLNEASLVHVLFRLQRLQILEGTCPAVQNKENGNSRRPSDFRERSNKGWERTSA